MLTSKKIKLSTRKRMVRCYVLFTPNVCVRLETWILSRDAENKIDAFDMWLYRRMLKVSYKDRMSNEEVLSRVKAKKKLLSELKNRKLQYMGHILRSSRLQKQLVEWKVGSRRIKGRARNTHGGQGRAFTIWQERRKTEQSGEPWHPEPLMDKEPYNKFQQKLQIFNVMTHST
ncbi:hypothetical protein HOLleu_26466 [Holothuria leucospilota]|uniref:Uncharacterized protein n=1 Tax=Holothuria leucospilota TaxID=206669 RepID=A0A9Q1BP64_HOLLE|nr:hypothetical protein HOLleu_26466 [Holothuria leucospilota]